MEQKYLQIQAAGLGLAAISYDSPAVLKNFAERKHIQFPLLSDTDSKIIQSFGILNENVAKGNPSYGIPHPGIYILDSRGIVEAKFFEDDYRQRDTAGLILLKRFGINPATPSTSIAAKHIELSVAASDSETHPGHNLALILNMDLPPGLHVYAPGVQGYIPIDWNLPDTPAAKAAPVTYPPSKLMRLEAIHETVPVYEGHVQLIRNVQIGSQNDISPLLDSKNDLTIAGTFRYQACDAIRCFVPETVPVSVTLHVEALDRTRVPDNLQRH